MTSNKQPVSIWHGQALHFIAVSILISLSWLAWSYLGKPFAVAFWAAIAFPIIHQMFVWLSWRLELRSSMTSRVIGFKLYLVIFFVLFGGRFLTLFIVAWLDQDSFNVGVVSRAVITSICLLLGGYAMYSVKRYFGMARAAGADHFDPTYRSAPLVKEGIFRYTSNAMYIYAFLLFLAIAIGFNSASAIVVAAFSHLYIRVHFYCTEKPDMDLIYGSEKN